MNVGAALLDLLNTSPVVDGHPVEQLDEAWLAAHEVEGVTVDAARRLRDDLQAVVRDERDAAALNAYVRGVRRIPKLTRDGLDWTTEADWPGRMVLEWGELQRELPGRLRPCANDECRQFLIDRSRAGTARWCSMSGCGNRMKARRHYSRTRQD